MKKVLSSITVSFLLMFIAGCTIVHNPAPEPATSSTEIAEVKKENNRESKRKKRDGRTPATETIKNQVVNQKSNPTQTVTSKTPKAVDKVYRLKVTLTDIECIKGRDGGGDDPDDYGIQQYIVYKVLGKEKKFISRDINKFPNRINLGGQVPGIKNMLINGDMKNQIHVMERQQFRSRNRNMISNSLVFQITSKELEDTYASFKIYTWLKEYSSTNYGIKTVNNDKVLTNNVPISVKVKDVIEILSGVKSLNPDRNHGDPSFPSSIGGELIYRDFGSGHLRLANIQKLNPMVLEGPIIAHNSSLTTVFVWVQFELVD